MKKTKLIKRQELIVQYMPYASNQARKFCSKYGIDYMLEDFISIAYLGLCKAGKKYSITKCVSFSHFASVYILGAMMDEFRKMDVYSRSERQNRIQGLDVNEVVIVDLYEPLYSPNSNETYCLADTLEATQASLDDVIAKQEALVKLEAAIRQLPQMEQIVFCLYIMNKYTTYSDIGAILGLKEPRICQLIHKAKDTLKQIISEESNGTN